MIFAIAGAGSGISVSGLLWHDTAFRSVAVHCAVSFACASLVVSVFDDTIDARFLLQSIAAAVFVLSAVLGCMSLLPPTGHVQVAILRSYWFLTVCAGVASLLSALSRRALCRFGPMRVAAECLSSLALGAGIGFLQGVVISPGITRNAAQDGGALVGGVAGLFWGLASAANLLRRPNSVLLYGGAVLALLALAFLFAKFFMLLSGIPTIISALVIGFASERLESPLNGSRESISVVRQ
jgi:hypothetical protein